MMQRNLSRFYLFYIHVLSSKSSEVMNSVVRSKDNKPKSRRNDEVMKAVKHIEDDFRTERIDLSATTLLIKK